MLTAQADTLLSRIAETATALRHLPEPDFSLRPAPGKWSKKEIIGHLVDSAQNNIRRFITAQYEDAPLIVYAQDEWVRLSGYQDMPADDLIRLWELLNGRLAHLFRTLDPAAHRRTCNTGKDAPALHTLAWLADDYIAHLDHHLQKIFA